MHHPPIRPTSWRVLPTLLIVLAALALGAITARADQVAPAHAAVATHR